MLNQIKQLVILLKIFITIISVVFNTTIRNTDEFYNLFYVLIKGNVPAAISVVVLAFAPKNIYVVETILVIICGFKISAHLGFHVRKFNFSLF